MSTAEKVELVASVWETYGLAPAIAAVELPKSSWYYHRGPKVVYEEKYIHLRPTLEEIARKHPSYGIPRVTIELRENYDQKVNHKIVQRLLKLWDLSLLRSARRPKPSPIQRVIRTVGERANLVTKMAEIGLFQVAYTDFTELVYADGARKACLMPIIGHVCKMAYGWAVGERNDTYLALQAWQMAKDTFQQLAIPYDGMIVHHDQDSIYTGYRWTAQLLIEDHARLSYALNGAKDNTEMESFNGHFKTENRSLFLDAQSLAELCNIVTARMHYYNAERRHSSLDYVSPLAYIQRMRSAK
ncbi:MAG: integrase core domain-containing protein [Bacteroidetes bacterium]|nr:integrase core domain-containing protein [Bacteroidota bacterium]